MFSGMAIRFNTIITLLCCICNPSRADYSFTLQANQWDDGFSIHYLTGTSLYGPWTERLPGYWIRSLRSHWHKGGSGTNDDRIYNFDFVRPSDGYLDWDAYDVMAAFDVTSDTTVMMPRTTKEESFVSGCGDPEITYFISYIDSVFEYHLGADGAEDRDFQIACTRLPLPYKASQCAWTGWTAYEVDTNLICANGLVRTIHSERDNSKHDRRFRLLCCTISNTPMFLNSGYGPQKLLMGISSQFDPTTKKRSIQMADLKFGWATFAQSSDVVQDAFMYPLTNGVTNVWTRVCPKNGALAYFAYDVTGLQFVFTCALLHDQFSVVGCAWTEYVNNFDADFDAECPLGGVIRGIYSYKSMVSGDPRFKLYCCALKRQGYVKDNTTQVALKTGTIATTGVITLDLCWNNDLYQGIVLPVATDQWYTAEDVVKHGTCGNPRVFVVSTSSSDAVSVASLRTVDAGVSYTIDGFNVTRENDTTPCDEFCMDVDASTPCTGEFISGGNPELIIAYPDAYLTSCDINTNGPCVAKLYFPDDYRQYHLSIVLCSSFDQDMSTPHQIGIILRGLNGNLDRKTLQGDVTQEDVGIGNIGEILHISMEHESGPDFCIQALTVHDPYNAADLVFGRAHFGDGVILSADCQSDGHFKRLTGTQFVPCFDAPFAIKPYETSLYTSIQIHACDAIDGGIASENSNLLSLTVTGLSKSDVYINRGPYSLASSEHWTKGQSRDFTFQISGGVKELSIVSITNNDDTDALCVDSVLINGLDAFLTHYWVGRTTVHKGNIPTIPAVLSWPICDIEYWVSLDTESKIPMDPDTVATSVCVNRNRLVSVDCEISQTFETYEEVSWEHQLGVEKSLDITVEKGKEFSKSKEHGWSVGLSVQKEWGAADNKVTVGATAGYSHSIGSGRTWSTSRSTSIGQTSIDMTTDGKVNGQTIGVSCSASVSVPPSQQIVYMMLIEKSETQIDTKTDMKMTKCSAWLYGEDHYDPNDYIYIYGIKGKLYAKDATNCRVEFSQATQVNADAITCGKERVLAARQWGTYVPQCDKTDPTKYMKCQCAFGDSLTCACVDESSGNLLETDTSSVVIETDEYKWTHWCNEWCGNDSFIPPTPYASLHGGSAPMQSIPKKVHAHAQPDDRKPVEGAPVVTDYYPLALGITLAVIAAVAIYLVNSCKRPRLAADAFKYEAINQFDGEVNVEIDK
eukprot:471568_1